MLSAFQSPLQLKNRLICFAMISAFVWPVVAVHAQDAATENTPLVEGQVFDYAGSGVKAVHVDLYRAGTDLTAKPLLSVITEGFGDFKIPKTVSITGDVTVVFTKEGYARVERTVTIEEGAFPPFVDVQLPGANTLKGIVRARETKEPVADAVVQVASFGRDWRVTTGEDGTFAVEGTHEQSGQLSVQADGFGKLTMNIPSLAVETPIEIDLDPERIVRIVTLDWRGNPVSDVDVEMRGTERDDFWYDITDAEGKVVFKGLSRETTTLNARLDHRNFVSDVTFSRELELPEDDFDTEHRLTLFSAGAIKGKVIDAKTGRKLQGARITLGATIDPNQPVEWTDLTGSYELTGVSPGKDVVTVYLSDYAPQLHEVRIVANETTEVDFALKESKIAKGIVLGPDKKPIENAYIVASEWQGCTTLAAQATTNEKGEFELYNIPDEEFEVAVQAFKHEPLLNQKIKPGKMDHRFELKVAEKFKPGGAAPNLGPKVGDTIPDLELTTLDGNKIEMQDLRGKVVLLDFWATWCGPCVVEIPNLVNMYKGFANDPNFVFLGISLDGNGMEKAVGKFAKKNKMKWPQIVGDRNGADVAAKKCGVTFIPRTILVGPDGKIHAMDILGDALKKEVKTLLDKLKK